MGTTASTQERNSSTSNSFATIEANPCLGLDGFSGEVHSDLIDCENFAILTSIVFHFFVLLSMLVSTS